MLSPAFLDLLDSSQSLCFPIPISTVFRLGGRWPSCRYWITRKDFTSHASFADDKPISGIQSSTAKLTAGNKTVDTLLVPDSFNHELAGLVKIDFKALDQWLEEMRCVVSGHNRWTVGIASGRHWLMFGSS
jgi:hypothetical protein